ncbi:hypothetical protein GCM10010399_42360 [Dactylosporangium fulvum]|uniref:Secreted protein n=1 Tax=Dactylosporangium fulvum TaxID=53359 RepID=A0ABY5VXQ6_9ACTN|nr:hypothetical protein [Dactylosporangium fulvum]UWP81584.1 hypothetical protein Dfulv_41780 [Dactylosporangium fulvum]
MIDILKKKFAPLAIGVALIAGLIAGSAALADASTASPAGQGGNSGTMFEVKDGNCHAWGRYMSGPSFIMGSVEDLVGKGDKANCWKYVKVWIHNYEKKKDSVFRAQGSESFVYTPFIPNGAKGLTLPKGNWEGKTGNVVIKAEIGVCATSKHCVKRTIPGVRKNW